MTILVEGPLLVDLPTFSSVERLGLGLEQRVMLKIDMPVKLLLYSFC